MSFPQKYRLYWKNVSNKNWIKFNFLQKTQWAYVFIFPRCGGRGHQRFAIPISAHYISKMTNLWCLLAPLLRKIKTCAYRVFCRKFNFIKFLFEAFFNTVDTVGSVQLPKWTNFSIPARYLKNGKFLVPPTSIPGGDKDMRLLSFL